MSTLVVKNFAQIEEASIEFGDLTVLVGPQATGKSLLLQWLKLSFDAGEVVRSLKEAGHDVRLPTDLVDLVFGEGMSTAWNMDRTKVSFDERPVSPSSWKASRRKGQEGEVFFIPAHRALLLAEGWPAPFAKLNADTPVVARLFSQNLYQRFSGRQTAPLFPVRRNLKEEERKAIAEAVFHGGKVQLQKEGLRYRLHLAFSETMKLPFMSWSAGQREFTPLLLGLYHVLVPRHQRKRPGINWVVIEEPEMGLHPQGIAVFMLLVLDLLWRSYKVVISTHSPLVLDIVWAIRHLSNYGSGSDLLCDAFDVKRSPAMRKVMENALRRKYRVYFLGIRKGSRYVTSRDISGLDPGASGLDEANWGGLTGFSARFGDAVRKAAEAGERA